MQSIVPSRIPTGDHVLSVKATQGMLNSALVIVGIITRKPLLFSESGNAGAVMTIVGEFCDNLKSSEYRYIDLSSL